MQHKYWTRADSQVSFLEWREGNKELETAIPFNIYHIRSFSLVFSFEQSIGTGFRCSNKVGVKKKSTRPPLSP